MRRGEFIVFLAVLVFFGSGGFFVAHAQLVAPTDTVATPVSACGIDLTWDQEAPGAHYFSYQRSTDNFVWSSVQFSEPPSEYFGNPPVTGSFFVTNDNLFSGTGYRYRIRTCSTNECVPSGNDWIYFNSRAELVTPSLPGVPATPTLSEAIGTQDGGNQYIELAWLMGTPVSEYGGFSIFRSENGGAFEFIDAVPYDARSYRDINGRAYLDLNSYYGYYVVSYDSNLHCSVDPSRTDGPTTDPNNQAVFSSPSNEGIVPIRPTNLEGLFDGSAMQLTWDDNSGTDFEVFKATDVDFTIGLTTFTVSSGNTLSDSAWNDDVTYYYKVRACSGTLKCSIFSNVIEISTGLSAPQLSARVIYASSASRDGTVFLSWIGVGGANEYELHRSTDPGFATYGVLVTQSAAAQPTFFDNAIPFGETYYYRLRATDGAQTSLSNIVPLNFDILYMLRGVSWAAMGISSNPIGAGWIKFNSASEGGSVPSPHDYSVQIDRDGLMSGMAWAESGYAWLSFNRADLVGECPSGTGTCEARMDMNTGNLSGWARFLAPQLNPDIDIWDGWVHLSSSTDIIVSLSTPASSFASLFNIKWPLRAPEIPLLSSLINIVAASYIPSSVDYGVSMDLGSKNFSGIAWGSDIIGWMAFGSTECSDCTVRAELINRAPSVSNVEIVAGGDWCVEVPSYSVAWQFSDLDGDNQVAAEVEFVELVDDLWVVGTSTVVIEGDQTHHFGDPLGYEATGSYNQMGYLRTNTTYTPRVRVNDGFDWSGWVVGDATTTQSHYGPYVDGIIWDPVDPAVPSFATATAVTFDRSGMGIAEWSWTFEGASPTPWVDTVPGKRVFITSGTVTSTIAVTDVMGDTFSTCVWEQSDTFGASGGESIKRRIFRER